MGILTRPYFQEEDAAHTFLERILWPSGTVGPHCGVAGTAYKIAANPEKRVRYDLWRCYECRKQFTCKIGTVLEPVRIPRTRCSKPPIFFRCRRRDCLQPDFPRLGVHAEGRLAPLAPYP